MDRLNKTKGTTQKKEIFSKYLNKWRSNYGLDFYDAMRMFLPKVYLYRLGTLRKRIVVDWLL
jgi:hypothetical protein